MSGRDRACEGELQLLLLPPTILSFQSIVTEESCWHSERYFQSDGRWFIFVYQWIFENVRDKSLRRTLIIIAAMGSQPIMSGLHTMEY